MSILFSVAIAGSLALHANAHGIVSGIVAGGKYHLGYNPSIMQFQDPPPKVAGWSIPIDSDLGFVAPDAFADPDIICHKDATNGKATITVAAGDQVELQWTPWPESHHGPVIDYLANCRGSCETVKKASLEFFKIDGVGLLDGSTAPGSWGSDKLLDNNNTWAVTIPSSIAPGNYVLRHEIIALHAAQSENGAQNYPQCVNLKVTGSGTDEPSGVKATALYKLDDPGIVIDIYQPLKSYKVPGPPLYKKGASNDPPSSTTKTKAPTSATSTVRTTASSETPPSYTTPSSETPPSYTTPSSSATRSSPPDSGPTHTHTSNCSTPQPSKPLPPGTTMNDLLEWIAYLKHKKNAPTTRHARDFRYGAS